jgi:hypothetical protein
MEPFHGPALVVEIFFSGNAAERAWSFSKECEISAGHETNFSAFVTYITSKAQAVVDKEKTMGKLEVTVSLSRYHFSDSSGKKKYEAHFVQTDQEDWKKAVNHLLKDKNYDLTVQFKVVGKALAEVLVKQPAINSRKGLSKSPPAVKRVKTSLEPQNAKRHRSSKAEMDQLSKKFEEFVEACNDIELLSDWEVVLPSMFVNSLIEFDKDLTDNCPGCVSIDKDTILCICGRRFPTSHPYKIARFNSQHYQVCAAARIQKNRTLHSFFPVVAADKGHKGRNGNTFPEAEDSSEADQSLDIALDETAKKLGLRVSFNPPEDGNCWWAVAESFT